MADADMCAICGRDTIFMVGESDRDVSVVLQHGPQDGEVAAGWQRDNIPTVFGFHFQAAFVVDYLLADQTGRRFGDDDLVDNLNRLRFAFRCAFRAPTLLDGTVLRVQTIFFCV